MGDALVRVPYTNGFWELREGVGRCHGEGCRKSGGGMIHVVGEEEISDGIVKVYDPLILCGACLLSLILALADTGRLKKQVAKKITLRP